MSTRAQDFQSELNKQKHLDKPKRKKRPAPLRTHEQQKTDGETAIRHVSQHAARKASTVLEEGLGANGRPSRKSTRISANRAKRTTNLQLKAQRKVTDPSGRHGMRGN